MDSDTGKLLLDAGRFELMIERLCHQVLEDWGDLNDCCLIGIQQRGVFVSDRLHGRLQVLSGNSNLAYGKLDITFYRDDFRMRDKPLAPYPNEIDFLIADKNVLLVDDVLYTGRTIQAALSALQHYGRPRSVRLLVLADRRFNRHLPIQADYVGLHVDALDEAYIKVRWQEKHGKDEILLFEYRPD
jgi:pyrimidine operon attenuation protein/uracil phosphoribosyltransferase